MSYINVWANLCQSSITLSVSRRDWLWDQFLRVLKEISDHLLFSFKSSFKQSFNFQNLTSKYLKSQKQTSIFSYILFRKNEPHTSKAKSNNIPRPINFTLTSKTAIKLINHAECTKIKQKNRCDFAV